MHAIGKENGTLLRSVGSHAVRSTTAPKMVIKIIYMFMNFRRAASQFAMFPARTKVPAPHDFTTARGEIHARCGKLTLFASKFRRTAFNDSAEISQSWSWTELRAT
jgi:hypothetical protein